MGPGGAPGPAVGQRYVGAALERAGKPHAQALAPRDRLGGLEVPTCPVQLTAQHLDLAQVAVDEEVGQRSLEAGQRPTLPVEPGAVPEHERRLHDVTEQGPADGPAGRGLERPFQLVQARRRLPGLASQRQHEREGPQVPRNCI